MKLQGRTLMVRRTGDDVKMLQGELKALGYTVPDDEENRAFYGQGTANAVRAFQSDNALPASSIVNQATAEALTQKLASK